MLVLGCIVTDQTAERLSTFSVPVSLIIFQLILSITIVWLIFTFQCFIGWIDSLFLNLSLYLFYDITITRASNAISTCNITWYPLFFCHLQFLFQFLFSHFFWFFLLFWCPFLFDVFFIIIIDIICDSF